MAWGWHAVPFHFFNPKFTLAQYKRDLPAPLRWFQSKDGTPVVMDYPDEYYTALRLGEGELPWWNPSIGCGRAWIGNAQVHPFSPLLILFFLKPSPWTFSLQFLLGAFVCLLGAYRLCRLLELDGGLSFIGGALWTFNPFTAACYGMSSVWAYWFFPWACVGILEAAQGRLMRGWPLYACALALMGLCGQPETAILCTELTVVFGIFAWVGHRKAVEPWRFLLGFTGALAGAALLSAAQWYPILEVLKDAGWYKDKGVILSEIINANLDFISRPADCNFLLPVLLALLFFLSRLDWTAAAFGAMSLLCLFSHWPALAFGVPLRWLLLGGIIPPLHLGELAVAPLSVLAVIGLQALRQSSHGQPLGIVRRAVAVCVAAALTLWSVSRLFLWKDGLWLPSAWLLLCLTAFAALAWAPGRKMMRLGPFVVGLLLAFFPMAYQQFRYPSFSGCPQPSWNALLGPEKPAGKEPAPRFWAQCSPRSGAPYLTPNLCLLSGLQDIRSSCVLNPPGSFIFEPSEKAYLSYIMFTYSTATPQLLSFLNVDRCAVESRKEAPPFDVSRIQAGPRAFVVFDWTFRPDDRASLQAFRALFKEGKEWQKAAVLSGSTQEKLPGPHQGSEEKATVTWLEYSPEKISLRVECSKTALLVVTDAVNHLWNGSVDGEPSPVARVDVMFKGLFLNGGSHVVTMSYEKRRMAWSVWASLCAWLVLLAIVSFRAARLLWSRP